MRFLLIFAALAVIVLVARRLWGRKTPGRKRGNTLTGKMAQCAECGIYVPEQEALTDGEHTFCSAAHRDNFRNNPGAGR